MEELEKYREYKELNNEPPPIYNPDVFLDEENLLGLEINGEIRKISISLIALIIYLAGKDWINLEWKISFVKLKK